MTGSLIETVARIKELAGLGATPSYASACDEFQYETDVLNAAPALLGVLGEVREGDAMLLAWMLEENDGFDDSQWTEELDGQITNMLKRYQALAAKMEETE